MKTMRAIAAALALVALTSWGCWLVVGAGAGGATAVYVMGKLEDKLPHPVPAVHDAVLAALKDLNLPVRSDGADKLAAETKSELSDKRDVRINLTTESEGVTRISIRVGLTGDEPQSLAILNAVKTHLPSKELPETPKDKPKPSEPPPA